MNYNDILVIQEVNTTNENGQLEKNYNVLSGKQYRQIIESGALIVDDYKTTKRRTPYGLAVIHDSYKYNSKMVSRWYYFIDIPRASRSGGFAENEVLKNAYKCEPVNNDINFIKLYALVYRDGDHLEERFRYYDIKRNEWSA